MNCHLSVLDVYVRTWDFIGYFSAFGGLTKSIQSVILYFFDRHSKEEKAKRRTKEITVRFSRNEV